jgi:hypothetical protein
MEYIGCRQYTSKRDQDMPEIRNWKREKNTMQKRGVSAKVGYQYWSVSKGEYE